MIRTGLVAVRASADSEGGPAYGSCVACPSERSDRLNIRAAARPDLEGLGFWEDLWGSGSGAPGHQARPPAPTAELTRRLGTERTALRIRWAGVAFALLQALTYYRPIPSRIFPLTLGLIAVLLVGNIGASVAVRRVATLEGARRLAL